MMPYPYKKEPHMDSIVDEHLKIGIVSEHKLKEQIHQNSHEEKIP